MPLSELETLVQNPKLIGERMAAHVRKDAGPEFEDDALRLEDAHTFPAIRLALAANATEVDYFHVVLPVAIIDIIGPIA